MSIANVVTDEVIVPLTRDEAEMLTAKIAGHVDQAWRLLVIAYERQAHKALGFKSWEAYVGERFNISRQHAYRLIDHGFVVREIEASVGTVTEVTGDVSPSGDTFGLTEADSRDIKPVLAEVTTEIRETLDQHAFSNRDEDHWTCSCPTPVLSSLGECASCRRPPLGLLLARTERNAA